MRPASVFLWFGICRGTTALQEISEIGFYPLQVLALRIAPGLNIVNFLGHRSALLITVGRSIRFNNIACPYFTRSALLVRFILLAFVFFVVVVIRSVSPAGLGIVHHSTVSSADQHLLFNYFQQLCWFVCYSVSSAGQTFFWYHGIVYHSTVRSARWHLGRILEALQASWNWFSLPLGPFYLTAARFYLTSVRFYLTSPWFSLTSARFYLTSARSYLTSA